MLHEDPIEVRKKTPRGVWVSPLSPLCPSRGTVTGDLSSEIVRNDCSIIRHRTYMFMQSRVYVEQWKSAKALSCQTCGCNSCAHRAHRDEENFDREGRHTDTEGVFVVHVRIFE